MGITSEYREDVEELESSVEEKVLPRNRASRLKSMLDSLLPFALLSLAFVFLIGLGVPVGERTALMINYLNWGVIAYFASRLVISFRLSRSNKEFFREHWLDFALVIPAFTLLREVRAVLVLDEIGFLSFEEDMVAGSAFASRNMGVFTKLTRIVRVVKKSL